MEKGYESILKCLSENEKIIFTTDKNFKFGEKNTLVNGEKFFCISNLGKIYIADKNRRLKAIRVSKYDYEEKGVKFNVLNKDNIVAINSRDFTDNRTESFIINMKLNDFTEISKKLLKNPFIYSWSKYSVKIDEAIYEGASITLEKEYINIITSNREVNLHFLDIIDFKEKDNSLHIISNSKEVYNILIYTFNKEIKVISKAIQEAKEVKKHQDNIDNIDKEKKSDIDLNYTIDATIIDTDGKFRQELDRTISNYYRNELINSKNIQEDVEKKEEAIEIKEDIINIKKIVDIEEPKVESSKIELKKIENKSYGKLYGNLNFINYKGRQVEITIEDELKIFDKELNKELASIQFGDYKYTKNDTIVILKKENNMILIDLEEQDLELDNIMTNHIKNTEYIGYTDDLQPFELKFIEHELILLQSEESIVIKIKINKIADINLLTENLNFESLAITLINSEIYKIFIMRASVKGILKEFYKLKSYKKYIECDKNIRENTFKNMMKDELSIFYFADIIKIKNMIDNFYKDNIKNKKVLVENLYNTAIKVKKSYNLIQMYYFEKFNIDFDFRMLKTIQELQIIELRILNLADKVLNLLSKLSSVKNINNYNQFKTKLNIDMCYFLDEVGIKIDEYFYETIALTEDITDYNFDEIIKAIIDEVNILLNIEFLYYSKILNCVVDELNIERNLNDEYLIEVLVEYFVQMQSKSKVDNKTRLKDVLLNIKKYSIMKNNSKSESIDILNLVSF